MDTVLGVTPLGFRTKLLRNIDGLIFRAFVVVAFFIYYETKVIPGTLHTWLMLVGSMFLLPVLIRKYGATARLPLDYCLVLILVLLVSFGYLLNFETTNWPSFQAYMLMLLTYVYVKENTTNETLAFLSLVLKSFLLINGLLTIAQALTGDYFPARYLAAGDPPLLIASGVSDGPTKNGMLIAFALSFMFAHFLFKKLPFSYSDTVIFVVGVVSLFFCTSRAALVSFGAVVVLGGTFALIQGLANDPYRIRFGLVVAAVVLMSVGLYLVSQYDLGVQALYGLRDPGAGHYGLDVALYKVTNFLDASIAERFGTVSFLSELVAESPLHIFSVGFGAGTFETLYGLNMHNSWLELMATTGVLGFIAFVVLVSRVLRRALANRGALRIVPVIFALVSVMVFMLAHDVLRGRIFWIALGFIAGFSRLRNTMPSTDPGRAG